MRTRIFIAAAAIVGASGAARAQSKPAVPPIRPLGRIEASTHDSLRNINSIRVLSDGRVIVNDLGNRRVLLYDADLSHFRAIADTTSETAKAYGTGLGVVFAYPSDSTLFLDASSRSMIVFDASGKNCRVLAAPQGPSSGFVFLTGPTYNATADAIGNIVVRWPAANIVLGRTTGPGALPEGLSISHDSNAIVRINVESKVTDTSAYLSLQQNARSVVKTGNAYSIVNLFNPFPQADDWTLMPDGTVAVVRVSDYHIDWYPAHGSKSSSPRIAHDWVRLTDSMKDAVIDSIKRADSISRAEQDSARAAAPARQSGAGGATRGGGAGGGGAAGGGSRGGGVGSDQSDIVSMNVSMGRGPGRTFMDPADMPSYIPPFESSGAKTVVSDADGNVWIRAVVPNAPAGGPIYDVVNRDGILIDRVQIPGGTTIVGFGRGGVVYLISRTGTGASVARARVH